MEKIVVLNSGGFDSTVLIHYVREQYPDAEIHSLHFSYGQRSCESELRWSNYHAKQVSAKIKEIELPKFDWTKSNFYEDGFEYKSQYLEWRNLIFLSYALSYAKAEGANSIYCAFLISIGYEDTAEKFLHEINLIGNGIKVIAPFSNIEYKEDLIPLAFSLGILPYTFHSCDVSNDIRGCRNCGDCQALEVINQELTLDTPIKIYRHCGTAEGEEFNKLCLDTVAWELRVLWNDDCQLNCAHCFYGKAKMLGNKLTHEEFLNVVEQAFEIGISSIHISGKEPLYDDSIIKFISDVNKLRGHYKDTMLSLVTNGINVPKYARELKLAGLDKIFISVDDIIGNDTYILRKTSNKIAFNAINSAFSEGLDVEVFINIHEKNYDRLAEIISFLETHKGVKNFFLVMLKSVGNGKNISRLNIKEVEMVINSLIGYVPSNDDTSIGLGFGIYYKHLILAESPSISNLILDSLYLGNDQITDWFYIRPEFYCSSYLEQVTLSPDGYILGCATDICRADYDKISAGNIRDSSLHDLIRKGKIERNFKCNNFKCNPYCFEGCPHEFEV